MDHLYLTEFLSLHDISVHPHYEKEYSRYLGETEGLGHKLAEVQEQTELPVRYPKAISIREIVATVYLIPKDLSNA